MAIKYATKAGNWSDTTVWNGGTLPEAGDDVYSNTYIVTIDQNVTVTSLQNGATTGVSANGYFVPSNGVTVTANVICGSSVHGTIAVNANVAWTLNGNVSNNSSNNGISINGADSTTTINGNVTASATSTGSGIGIASAAARTTINITGNVYGGRIGQTTVNGVNGIAISAETTINVTGNLIGGAGGNGGNNSTCSAIYANSRSEIITINVTGNVYGGSGNLASYASGIFMNTCPNARITINGNVYGTTGTSNSAMQAINVLSGANGIGFLTITGNIYGSTTGGNEAIYVTTSGVPVTINGNCIASVGSCCVLLTSPVVINSDILQVSGTASCLQLYSSTNVTARTALIEGSGNLFYCLPYGTTPATAINITVTEPVATTGSSLRGCLIYAVNGALDGRINFTGTIDERGYTFESPSTASIYVNNIRVNLTVNGEIICGQRSGIWLGPAGNTITINGNLTAGNFSTSTASSTFRHGIYAASNVNTINIYGRLTGTNGSNNSGIYNSAASTIFAQVCISNNYPTDVYANYAIYSNWNASLKTTALEYGTGGLHPIVGKTVFVEAEHNYVKIYNDAGAILTLGEIAADYPSVSNVRLGTKYNFNSQTGTCAVPDPGSVAKGVPVDHTEGTAVLTAEALWALPTSDMTTPGSIGERLKNSSTVDTVGAQLAALL